MKINDLKEERAGLVAKAREINNKAEGEKRDLSPEEQESWDKHMKDVRSLAARIERQEELDKVEREQAAAAAETTVAQGSGAEERSTGVQIVDGFRSWVRYGMAESRSQDAEATEAFRKFASERALQMGGGGPSGGYLVVPTELWEGIVKDLDNEVFVRQFATKETLDQTVNLGVPTLESDPGDFEWTTELGTGGEDNDMAFGRRDFMPNPVAKRAKVSLTLLQRSSRPVEQILRDRLFYKLGITQEKAFLTGNGAGQPLGLFTESDDGIPASRNVANGNSSTDIGFDGLINAKYSLTASFRRNARWIFHRDAVSRIAKIKDNDGRYIWRVSEREGEPDMLLGHGYFESEYAPSAFTTGKVVGCFGNLSFYWIVDSTLMYLKRLEELYAEDNQIGFIIRHEADGMPVRANAFARVALA